ncbi:MAG: efflux RND transporter permease subunit, partial [Hyphomicrobiales bacterium]|nr:efflux RND transporter permease subunit [Hyphomicrobiales bacterium]
GFIVDDAIVMIENIVRKMEGGMRPLRAAFAGAREIGFTVISLTVSLIAVFIPLLFMTGLVGRMFREFALTLSIAVVVSAIVSLTLTPMMCGRLLKPKRADSEASREAAEATGWMLRVYERSLRWAVDREFLMLLVTAGTLALTIWLYVVAPKGFLPLQDNSLLDVVVEAAPDASFEHMTRIQAKAAEAFRADPDVRGVVSVLGVGALNATPNVGRLAATLIPRDDRTATAIEIAERLRAKANEIGANPYVKPVQDI